MVNNKVTIVDAIMGSGKSSWAIQYMNENDDYNFLYITPFLSEVDRIKEQCTRRIFTEPVQDGNGKMENLLNLLEKGYNVVLTETKG